MENSEIKKSLDIILEKRKNCIPLTNEEEKLANESLNKLLDAKKCINKTVTSTTGDEIRKSAASPVLPKAPSTDKATEGLPPKNRGKEGGYDSKADVTERIEEKVSTDISASSTRDEKLTDQKEEKLPSEKTDGKPYGDKTKEEWADVDNKKFKQENYQEDRLGRMTEHADYKDSIKTQSIVVKTMTNGNKMVGQVLKVYSAKNGQTGLMVKWSDGRFEHVNQDSVELLKILPLAAAALGAGAIVAGNVISEVGGHLATKWVDSMAQRKAKKIKAPRIPGATDASPETSGNIVTNKSVEESDTEKGILSAAGKVLAEGVKHPRAAIAGAGALLAGQFVADNTKKSDDTNDTEKGISDLIAGGLITAGVGAGAGAIAAGKGKRLRGAGVGALGGLGGIVGGATAGYQMKHRTDDTEKVTGSVSPDEVAAPVAEALPQEAPEEFIRSVVDTLKELTDLSEEEIVKVAQSAWSEIAAENAGTEAPVEEKVMENNDIQKPEVQKDAFDDALSVASPIQRDAYNKANPKP